MKNPEPIFEMIIIIMDAKTSLNGSDFLLSNCLTTSMNKNMTANDMNLSAMPPLTRIDKNNVAVIQYKVKISILNPFFMEFSKINAITTTGMRYTVSPKYWKVLW